MNEQGILSTVHNSPPTGEYANGGRGVDPQGNVRNYSTPFVTCGDTSSVGGQAVDFANKMQRNRHDCPADTKWCRGNCPTNDANDDNTVEIKRKTQ
jgi:hypothetical protein